MKHIFLLLALSAVFFSCSHKAEHVEKAFYYWKNNKWELKGQEQQLLDTLKIRTMFLKCFEVEYKVANSIAVCAGYFKVLYTLVMQVTYTVLSIIVN